MVIWFIWKGTDKQSFYSKVGPVGHSAVIYSCINPLQGYSAANEGSL